MERLEMRITAMDDAWVCIQRKTKGTWEQFGMNDFEFEAMMRAEFPEYWEKYLEADTVKSPIEFFYNYGETEEMMRNGEAFIYK